MTSTLSFSYGWCDDALDGLSELAVNGCSSSFACSQFEFGSVFIFHRSSFTQRLFSILCRIFVSGSSVYLLPQCRSLDISLPVPSGRTATGGGWLIKFIWSITDKIHPTVPSPPPTSKCKLGVLRYSSNLKMKKVCLVKKRDNQMARFRTDSVMTHANFGQLVWFRSKICLGFRSHMNFLSILLPKLPPLFGLINTNNGLWFWFVNVDGRTMNDRDVTMLLCPLSLFTSLLLLSLLSHAFVSGSWFEFVGLCLLWWWWWW